MHCAFQSNRERKVRKKGGRKNWILGYSLLKGCRMQYFSKYKFYVDKGKCNKYLKEHANMNTHNNHTMDYYIVAKNYLTLEQKWLKPGFLIWHK